MKIKPISRTIKATALTNPNPSFVSQVKAGANQRPFRAIKMDAAVPVSDTTEAPMKIKRTASTKVKAIAPKGYGVAQFEFSKEKFADEAAVKKWLDDGGYSDYTIVATSKGFEVSDTDSSFEPGSVARIDGGVEGLTVFVGKFDGSASQIDDGDEEGGEGDEAAVERAAEEEPVAAVEGEEAAPAIDPPARVRAAPAPAEGGQETEAPEAEEEAAPEGDAPAPAAKAEGEEEPAPAAEEPAPAEEPAAPAAKAEGDPAPAVEEPAAEPTDADRAKSMLEAIGQVQTQKGVYEAAALGQIVNQLGWIVYDADYSGLSDETVAKIKAAALALLDAFMQAATDAADELTAVFRTAEETAARAAPVAEEAAPADDMAALVAAAVEKAMQPVIARAEAAEAAATEASERAQRAEAELSERVEADNARGQTRKGADDPIPDVSTDKPQERSRASQSILSSFGSRHARN